ncbi:MAG: hypothetical protein ACYDCO_16630 [Armatimonadota bacterium]
MKDQPKTLADTYLEMMQAQFGDSVKAFWFYEGDRCPCCGELNPIAEMTERERTISLNGYMYRARGVLIGYILCIKCANAVMAACQEKEARLTGTTPLHQQIEQYLMRAYHRYLSSLNA